MIEFDLKIFMCSMCTQVFNNSEICQNHETSEHNEVTVIRATNKTAESQTINESVGDAAETSIDPTETTIEPTATTIEPTETTIVPTDTSIEPTEAATEATLVSTSTYPVIGDEPELIVEPPVPARDTIPSAAKPEKIDWHRVRQPDGSFKCYKCDLTMLPSRGPFTTHWKVGGDFTKPVKCPKCCHRFAHHRYLDLHLISVHFDGIEAKFLKGGVKKAKVEVAHEVDNAENCQCVWCQKGSGLASTTNDGATVCLKRPAPEPRCSSISIDDGTANDVIDGFEMSGKKCKREKIGDEESEMTARGEIYLLKNSNISHPPQQRDETALSCPKCHLNFRTTADLQRHARSSEIGSKTFNCTKCCEWFEKRTYLKYHMEVLHKQPFSTNHKDVIPESYQCAFCDRKFALIMRRKEHMLRCGGRPTG